MTDVVIEPQVTTGPIPYSEKIYREIEAPGGAVMKVPFRRTRVLNRQTCNQVQEHRWTPCPSISIWVRPVATRKYHRARRPGFHMGLPYVVK